MKIEYRKNEDISNDHVEEVYVNNQYVGDLFLYQEEGQLHTFFPEGGQPVERWEISEKEMKAEVEELLAQFFGDDETEADVEVESEEKRSMTMNLQYFAEKGVKMFSNGLIELPVKEVNGQIMFDAEQSAIGLGITSTAKGYTNVRWSRVNDYLNSATCGRKIKKGDFITEPQFYKLAIKANNSVAEKFQDWVTTEVLPSIRKHGAYMTDQMIEEVLTNPDTIIKLATQLKTEREGRLIAEQRVNELTPKATYYDQVLNNKSLVTITQIAKDYGMSGGEMNKKLHELGVIYKQGNTWLLYSRYQRTGWTHSNTIMVPRADGTEKAVMQTKWTQKGRLGLYEFLKKHDILPLIEQDDDVA
ncbi:prophage antirepressor [Ligilactobacillus equi DSM 15833 = JCM 10991]|uniref:Prophage antirepressor n=2 Tax=Ligilactobacillus equi TaxID=137357 RepID=A0A0R1T5L6_9LACO|nr:prophage antirepressor [Ligilactobacillus equi DSM 15833 = JCM 10991]